MNILDFDPKEQEETLDQIESDPEALEEFKQSINSSYHSLLFLGKNILKSKDKGLLDVAIFNIRLLFVFYRRSEDYEKLAQLKNLAMLLESSETDIVDRQIIEDIVVNLN